ncbi:MAG: response regulator [Arenicellales bacterium]
MNSESIRLLVVASVPSGEDTGPKLLEQLEAVVRKDSRELEVVGIAHNRKAALEQVARTRPDVMLIDLALPVSSSTDIISFVSLMHSDVKILALCPADIPHERVVLAIQAGALGYVSRDAAATDLYAAIQTVLSGERYLPIAETYEVLQQVAPELLASARKSRENLAQALMTLVPAVGIIGALTEFLWRSYWGQIGVRVGNLGVDASSRATEAFIAILVVLGLLGPLMFVDKWISMALSRRHKNRLPQAVSTETKDSKMDDFRIGGWSMAGVARYTVALMVLVVMVTVHISGEKMITIVVGTIIAMIFIAHAAGISDSLPGAIRVDKSEIRKGLVVFGVIGSILLSVLSAEIFLRGPILRPDGLHGVLAPEILGLSARPVKLYDVTKQHKPLGLLYLGGNGDLYVMYDPCKKTTRFVSVSSARVEFIDKVDCSSTSD